MMATNWPSAQHSKVTTAHTNKRRRKRPPSRGTKLQRRKDLATSQTLDKLTNGREFNLTVPRAAGAPEHAAQVCCTSCQRPMGVGKGVLPAGDSGLCYRCDKYGAQAPLYAGKLAGPLAVTNQGDHALKLYPNDRDPDVRAGDKISRVARGVDRARHDVATNYPAATGDNFTKRK